MEEEEGQMYIQRAGQVYLCRVGERDNIWHNKVPWPANRDRKV